jgi:DNA-binding Lrp family transcriptional regulator
MCIVYTKIDATPSNIYEINLEYIKTFYKNKMNLTIEVITSDISVIDPEKVGAQILLFVEVELDTDKIEFIDDIKRTFSKVPQIQQCYYVTGEVDFVLVMVVNTMQEYELLTRQLFFSNTNIKRFKTFVNMHTVKNGLQIPILGS